MKNNLHPILLAVGSGILLGAAFPPIPTGATIFVAFIPFFLLHSSLEKYGQLVRYSYLTFLTWNLITLYWPGGLIYGKDLYMIVGGILLLFVHPLFYLIPVTVWYFIRRQIGFAASLIAFPFIWTGFEYLHSLTEIAFPWLLLGNTQTYDLTAAQIAELIGTYGISFWIVFVNVLGFYLFVKILLGEWKISSLKSLSTLAVIIFIYILPKAYGTWVIKNKKDISGTPVEIVAVQPNIDTFEKWTGNPEKPLEIVQQMTGQIGIGETDLVIWPETTTPFYFLHPGYWQSFESVKQQIKTLNTNLLSGIPDIYYYHNDEPAPKSSKKLKNGLRYDTYNSSVLLRSDTDTIQKYAKIRLVPFAERVPFSEELSFLNAMQWNFGLGGWGIGKDTTVFMMNTREGNPVKFSAMICYESIYPSLVSSFVRKGAEFLCIVTNDSWWGNTSGAYQHKQYAVLRAVENRRWVIQCANGGISCFIDPYGNVVRESPLYIRTILKEEIRTNRELTFYTLKGDWVCEISLVAVLVFIAASAGQIFYLRIRKLQQKDNMNRM